MIRITGHYECSSSNGEGWRSVFFVGGCPHRCDGCQNPNTWDFNSGEESNYEEIISAIRTTQKKFPLDGITLSGGEPIQNRYYEDIKRIVDYSRLKGMTTWCYTGFDFEDLDPKWRIFDVIVDGKFVKELMSDCKFRGSTNQTIWRRKDGKYRKD